MKTLDTGVVLPILFSCLHLSSLKKSHQRSTLKIGNHTTAVCRRRTDLLDTARKTKDKSTVPQASAVTAAARAEEKGRAVSSCSVEEKFRARETFVSFLGFSLQPAARSSPCPSRKLLSLRVVTSRLRTLPHLLCVLIVLV